MKDFIADISIYKWNQKKQFNKPMLSVYFLLLGFNDIETAQKELEKGKGKIVDFILPNTIISPVLSIKVTTYETWFIENPCMDELALDIVEYIDGEISIYPPNQRKGVSFTLDDKKIIWLDIGETNKELSEWFQYRDNHPEIENTIKEKLLCNNTVTGKILYVTNSALDLKEIIANGVPDIADTVVVLAAHDVKLSQIFSIENTVYKEFPNLVHCIINIVNDTVYLFSKDDKNEYHIKIL